MTRNHRTDPCTVTFDSQGGSAVAAKLVEKGKVIAKPVDPTRAGYAFGGWHRQAGCTSAWNFATDKVEGDMTLYAKWTANAGYNIKATPNNRAWGSVSGADRYDRNAAATLTAKPKSGCRFVKWLEGSKKVSGNYAYKFTVTKARTLKAEFATIGKPALSSVTKSGSGKITIKWKGVTGAKGYYVLRCKSKTGKYENIKTTSKKSFTDSGLVKGTKYYYKIQAYCTAGPVTTKGGCSNIKWATPGT